MFQKNENSAFFKLITKTKKKSFFFKLIFFFYLFIKETSMTHQSNIRYRHYNQLMDRFMLSYFLSDSESSIRSNMSYLSIKHISTNEVLGVAHISQRNVDDSSTSLDLNSTWKPPPPMIIIIK